MQEEYRNMNKKELQEVIGNLEEKLEWYDLFIDYIYETDTNKYNQACEYADNNQTENK
jgi:hypothetical protein